MTVHRFSTDGSVTRPGFLFTFTTASAATTTAAISTTPTTPTSSSTTQRIGKNKLNFIVQMDIARIMDMRRNYQQMSVLDLNLKFVMPPVPGSAEVCSGLPGAAGGPVGDFADHPALSGSERESYGDTTAMD